MPSLLGSFAAAANATAPALGAAAAAAANATAPALSTAAAAVANATAPAVAAGIAKVAIGWKGAVVAATLGVALIVMGFDAVGPDLVFAALAALYMVSGIISIKDGCAGFSNSVRRQLACCLRGRA